MITLINNKFEILSYAQTGKFIIYGAGQVGITLLRYLATKDLIDNVLYFVVSDAAKEPEEIMGVPVCGVAELPVDSRVLIAIHPKLHNEIVGILAEHNATDITGVSWDCYMQMRRLIPDFSTEQFLRQKHSRSILEIILKNTEQIICQPEVIATNAAAFGEYENAFKGRDVVLLGTGPSLSKYKPIDGAIHIGVNRAYKFDKVKLDYLFAQDFDKKAFLDIYGEGCLESYIDDLKKLSCKKFIGHLSDYSCIAFINLPEENYIGTDFVRYIHDHTFSSIMHRNIKFYPTFDLYSVIFSAINFALFAHPKRIYIVGCDGAKGNSYGRFDSKYTNDASFCHQNQMKIGWEKVKKFAEINYPDIEIMSINPGYLRGLFKDMEM